MLRAGLTVLEPVGTRHAFDLALLQGDRGIVRVQCKTSRRRGDCLLFNSCSTDHGAGRQHYVGRADVFAVADLASRDVYIVDVALAATRSTSLRLAPTRNGQRRRVLMAADHTIDRWLASEAAIGLRTRLTAVAAPDIAA